MDDHTLKDVLFWKTGHPPVPLDAFDTYQFQTATKTNSRSRRHKEHAWGVIVSHHPSVGPSRCRETSSGFPLIPHYW